jgi:drug/metabolite transporter (DMT)-like permease
MTENAPAAQRSYGGQSTSALVLGIIGVITLGTLFVAPVLAIIFGAQAIGGQRRLGERVNRMAVAGLALGIIGAMVLMASRVVG